MLDGVAKRIVEDELFAAAYLVGLYREARTESRLRQPGVAIAHVDRATTSVACVRKRAKPSYSSAVLTPLGSIWKKSG